MFRLKSSSTPPFTEIFWKSFFLPSLPFFPIKQISFRRGIGGTLFFFQRNGSPRILRYTPALQSASNSAFLSQTSMPSSTLSSAICTAVRG